MSGNGRLLRPDREDFVVEWNTGGTFSSDEGTWDEVPRVRRVGALRHGAKALAMFERYGFEWEAVARMPIGDRRGPASRGQVIAVRLFGTFKGTGYLARIDRDGRVQEWNGTAQELERRYPPGIWREGRPTELPVDAGPLSITSSPDGMGRAVRRALARAARAVR